MYVITKAYNFYTNDIGIRRNANLIDDENTQSGYMKLNITNIYNLRQTV